jgi:hypothetical protein
MGAVILWTTLLALGGLFYGPYQTQCEDWARQKLFEARDRVFDMAGNGRISFDDPRYVAIRHSMNILIRFTHELTWTRLLYINWFIKRNDITVESQLEKAVGGIDDEDLKADIERELGRMGSTVFRLMLMRSPFLIALFIGLLPLAVVGQLIDSVARFIMQQKDEAYRRSLFIAQRDAEWFDSSVRTAC